MLAEVSGPESAGTEPTCGCILISCTHTDSEDGTNADDRVDASYQASVASDAEDFTIAVHNSEALLLGSDCLSPMVEYHVCPAGEEAISASCTVAQNCCKRQGATKVADGETTIAIAEGKDEAPVSSNTQKVNSAFYPQQLGRGEKFVTNKETPVAAEVALNEKVSFCEKTPEVPESVSVIVIKKKHEQETDACAQTDCKSGDPDIPCCRPAADEAIQLIKETISEVVCHEDESSNSGDHAEDQTELAIPDCTIIQMVKQATAQKACEVECVTAADQPCEYEGETTIGAAKKANCDNTLSDSGNNVEVATSCEDTSLCENPCFGDCACGASHLACLEVCGVQSPAICLKLETSTESPCTEALETGEEATETKVVVCDLGLCVKTVAKINDKCTDLAGVRAGTCGVCAQVALIESGGECTDTASRDDNLVQPATNVTVLVDAVLTAADEDKYITDTVAEVGNSVQVTGCNGQNACSVLQSSGRESNATIADDSQVKYQVEVYVVTDIPIKHSDTDEDPVIASAEEGPLMSEESVHALTKESPETEGSDELIAEVSCECVKNVSVITVQVQEESSGDNKLVDDSSNSEGADCDPVPKSVVCGARMSEDSVEQGTDDSVDTEGPIDEKVGVSTTVVCNTRRPGDEVQQIAVGRNSTIDAMTKMSVVE